MAPAPNCLSKASQSFAAGAAKESKIIFFGDMCGEENTSRPANVRAANAYGLTAQRYGLQCSYPDAPVQTLLGCVRPEKAYNEQVLRSIIELELARGNDSVVLDSAQLCAAFAHFGLAAHYPQAADGMELLAQAALLHTAAAADARRA